jgi:sulfotransferase family protein
MQSNPTQPASSTASGAVSATVNHLAEPGAGPPRQQRMPDFFIVGHHKSGTTALYEMLRRRPQIYMPDLKEPRFFASDLRPLFQPSTSDHFPDTLEAYLALFAAARPEQRVGEASPSYLRSRTAAGAIAKLQPRARVIAILREPASFVRSLHFQLVQEHVESESDLGEAIAREAIVRAGQRVLRYSDHVHYVEQLGRYDAVFPPEQILVLIYDDFRADNDATVRRVLRFLNVDDSGPIEQLEANPTVRVRSLRASSVMRALYAGQGPVSRRANTTLKALLPKTLRARAADAIRAHVVYGDPQPADERVMRELRSRYKGEVVALSEYLGRDLLGLWGYDGPG